MPSTFVLRSLMLATLSACAAAQAAPTHLSTGQVGIDFDPDTFSFSHEVSSFGSFVTEDILPSSVTVNALTNGVELNFNDQMSVYASSYSNFSPETLMGNFSALFSFAPTAGYIITGYTVTYAGTYSIETPGVVSVSGPGGGFSASVNSGSFNSPGAVPGAVAPNLVGGISATGDVSYVEVLDHYESVFDRYESVLDYCEPDNPEICYYHDEPVYVDVPVYRQETDLGDASLNLQTISVVANVAAVPEPAGYALLAAGLPVAAWIARRRQNYKIRLG